jgi:hypothetical protein
MAQPLTPAQIAELQAVHKALAALQALEGKGGPVLAPTIATITADLNTLYQTLVGVVPGK